MGWESDRQAPALLTRQGPGSPVAAEVRGGARVLGSLSLFPRGPQPGRALQCNLSGRWAHQGLGAGGTGSPWRQLEASQFCPRQRAPTAPRDSTVAEGSESGGTAPAEGSLPWCPTKPSPEPRGAHSLEHGAALPPGVGASTSTQSPRGEKRTFTKTQAANRSPKKMPRWPRSTRKDARNVHWKPQGGTSLVVSWLRLHAPNCKGRVYESVGELDPTCCT